MHYGADPPPPGPAWVYSPTHTLRGAFLPAQGHVQTVQVIFDIAFFQASNYCSLTSLPHCATVQLHANSISLAPARSYPALMSQRLDPPAKYGIPTLAWVSTNWKMIRKERQEGQTGWKACLTLGDERAGRKVTCWRCGSPRFGRIVLVRDRYSDEQDSA